MRSTQGRSSRRRRLTKRWIEALQPRLAMAADAFSDSVVELANDSDTFDDGVRAAEIRIQFDPSRVAFDESSLLPGSAWKGRASLVTNVNQETGEVVAFLYSVRPADVGSLLHFNLDTTAPSGQPAPDASSPSEHPLGERGPTVFLNVNDAEGEAAFAIESLKLNEAPFDSLIEDTRQIDESNTVVQSISISAGAAKDTPQWIEAAPSPLSTDSSHLTCTPGSDSDDTTDPIRRSLGIDRGRLHSDEQSERFIGPLPP